MPSGIVFDFPAQLLLIELILCVIVGAIFMCAITVGILLERRREADPNALRASRPNVRPVSADWSVRLGERIAEHAVKALEWTFDRFGTAGGTLVAWLFWTLTFFVPVAVITLVLEFVVQNAQS